MKIIEFKINMNELPVKFVVIKIYFSAAQNDSNKFKGLLVEIKTLLLSCFNLNY